MGLTVTDTVFTVMNKSFYNRSCFCMQYCHVPLEEDDILNIDHLEIESDNGNFTQLQLKLSWLLIIILVHMKLIYVSQHYNFCKTMLLISVTEKFFPKPRLILAPLHLQSAFIKHLAIDKDSAKMK